MIIAIVFVLGLRTFYLASIAFNTFNLGIYLLSGVVAIPGITMSAFASHLQIISPSLSTTVLMLSWFAAMVLGLVLLKYDRGSEIDKLIVTERD